MTINGQGGQFAVRPETALGTSAASWEDIYMEEMPQIPTTTMKLIANSIKGYRNPLSVGPPVAVDMAADSAFRLKTRIRRVVTNADAPILTYLMESMGWKEYASSASTVEAGATATSFTAVAIGQITVGKAIMVQLSIDGTTVYWPCLVAGVAGDTITPSIALPIAPAEGAAIIPMDTYSPTSLTAQQVPTTKTLQFKLNSWRYFDDALGDGAIVLTGCAGSDLGAIELGAVGTVPMLDFGFHVSNASQLADDIDADAFTDRDEFLVINDLFSFAFAGTNSGSGIGTLVNKSITKVTINPGAKTIPVKAQGDRNSLGGNQAFVMQNEPATIAIEAHGTGDAAFDNEIFDQLAGTNDTKYIHCIQPTTSLDSPAFGIWLPCCRIAADGEPKRDDTGELPKFTVTYKADLSAWGGEESPDEMAASPIYMAINNEAAA